MYTTHGDMIIFRPDYLDRVSARTSRFRDGWADRLRERWAGGSRERRPDRPRESWADQPRQDRPSPSDSLRERIAELEARVSRLEAQLERVGERPKERLYEPDGAAERGASRRARRRQAQAVESPPVRVSLHADGGAQVSLGEVRMISQD